LGVLTKKKLILINKIRRERKGKIKIKIRKLKKKIGK
jgi:hypothetical protein